MIQPATLTNGLNRVVATNVPKKVLTLNILNTFKADFTAAARSFSVNRDSIIGITKLLGSPSGDYHLAELKAVTEGKSHYEIPFSTALNQHLIATHFGSILSYFRSLDDGELQLLKSSKQNSRNISVRGQGFSLTLSLCPPANPDGFDIMLSIGRSTALTMFVEVRPGRKKLEKTDVSHADNCTKEERPKKSSPEKQNPVQDTIPEKPKDESKPLSLLEEIKLLYQKGQVSMAIGSILEYAGQINTKEDFEVLFARDLPLCVIKSSYGKAEFDIGCAATVIVLLNDPDFSADFRAAVGGRALQDVMSKTKKLPRQEWEKLCRFQSNVADAIGDLLNIKINEDGDVIAESKRVYRAFVSQVDNSSPLAAAKLFAVQEVLRQKAVCGLINGIFDEIMARLNADEEVVGLFTEYGDLEDTIAKAARAAVSSSLWFMKFEDMSLRENIIRHAVSKLKDIVSGFVSSHIDTKWKAKRVVIRWTVLINRVFGLK